MFGAEKMESSAIDSILSRLCVSYISAFTVVVCRNSTLIFPCVVCERFSHVSVLRVKQMSFYILVDT